MNTFLSFSKVLLILFVFTFVSSCHDDFDCIDGDYLEIRYLHNGQNAIFGDQAILDQESISLSTTQGEMLSEKLSFVDSTMVIRLLIHPRDSLMLLHLGSLRTDTFEVIQWGYPRGRDCSIWSIETAKINGDILCNYQCYLMPEIQI